jgi:hypothetical protein
LLLLQFWKVFSIVPIFDFFRFLKQEFHLRVCGWFSLSLSLSLSLSCDYEFEIRNLEVGSKSVCLELCNPQFCLGLFHRLRKKKKKELGWVVAMKSTSAVGGVVEVALRRVLCILVLVVVVVVSEPTTTPVQGKPEDKSNRVEATRESTLQTVQNAVDKTGNKQKRFFSIKERSFPF